MDGRTAEEHDRMTAEFSLLKQTAMYEWTPEQWALYEAWQAAGRHEPEAFALTYYGIKPRDADGTRGV